ncbi:MAG: sulfurtransferase TusA family protein [Candidatus Helarchaeota archaeon]
MVKKELDLTGESCPYTFVYTKLNLELLKAGDILEVIVDYPPAVENIPHSVKVQKLGEILEVLKIDQNDKWKIKIRKI